MKSIYKYTKIASIVFTILITGIAIYGHVYGWASTIVIYHGEGEKYFQPVTIFEMWEKGFVNHRTFLMFPKKLYPPKLTMLTTTEDDPIVRESYVAFWVVIVFYSFGWFCLVDYLLRIKEMKSNQRINQT